MAKLTAGQVYAYARAAGFSAAEAVTMTAIAGAESGFDPAAVGDVGLQNATWGPSIGLWQVRSIKAQSGTGGVRDATRLSDPAFNAKSAYSIYKGQGLSAWSTYSNGAYKGYVATAQGGAVSGVQLPTSGTSGATGSITTGGFVTPDQFQQSLDQDSGLGGQIGSAIGGALTSATQSLWSQVQPFLVTGAAATLGLALLGAGVLVTAWPTVRQSVPSA